MAQPRTVKQALDDPKFLRALPSAGLDAGYNNITLSNPTGTIDFSDGAIEQLIHEMAQRLLSASTTSEVLAIVVRSLASQMKVLVTLLPADRKYARLKQSSEKLATGALAIVDKRVPLKGK